MAQLAEQLLLIRIQSFAKLYTEPVFTAGNWKGKNQDKEAENGPFKTKKNVYNKGDCNFVNHFVFNVIIFCLLLLVRKVKDILDV